MKPLTPEEERRWIERLKRRDERAFRLLVRRYQGTVYNVVLRMMGHRREDALDVSQEVFVTVFKAIDSFRGDSRIGTWIYRIAVNHTRNRLKYLARRRQDQHDAFEDTREGRHQGGEAFSSSVPRPDAQVEGLAAEAFLKRVIAELDDDQREVLVLREIEGLTYDEIGEITGLKPGTVKSRLHRARQAIAERYEAWRSGGETTSDTLGTSGGEDSR